MSQVMVNFRMDANLKKNMEHTCKELGLNMSTAFTIFAKKVAREGRIPFDVAIDPFYAQKNIAVLEQRIQELESGNTKLLAHDLIEE